MRTNHNVSIVDNPVGLLVGHVEASPYKLMRNKRIQLNYVDELS